MTIIILFIFLFILFTIPFIIYLIGSAIDIKRINKYLKQENLVGVDIKRIEKE